MEGCMEQKPLVELVRAQGWGDLLMATAVLQGLQAQNKRVRMITLPAFMSVFHNHPLVETCMGLPLPRQGSYARQKAALRLIREATRGLERPSKTIFLKHPPNYSGLRKLFSGNDDSEGAQWIPRQHALTGFCKQAGVPFSDKLVLPLSPEAWAWGEAYQDSVLIQMFSSDSRKDWPVSRWQHIAEQIRRDFGLPVYQVGSAKQASVPGIPRLENPTMHHAMAAVAQCRLFIGSDSVFNHVARAYHRPALILWSHTHPDRFGYGQNVNLWRGQLVLPKVGGQWPLPLLVKMSDRPTWNGLAGRGENTLAQVYWFARQMLESAVEIPSPTAHTIDASDTRIWSPEEALY